MPNVKNALVRTFVLIVMPHKTESSVMTKWATPLASVPQVSPQLRMDHASRMVALLILTVKFVMMPEELLFASNVSLQPTEFCNSHNTSVSARKVSSMTKVFADHVLQDVPSAQMPQLVKDVPFQPPTTTTEHVLAHKATSSPLSH